MAQATQAVLRDLQFRDKGAFDFEHLTIDPAYILIKTVSLIHKCTAPLSTLSITDNRFSSSEIDEANAHHRGNNWW